MNYVHSNLLNLFFENSKYFCETLTPNLETVGNTGVSIENTRITQFINNFPLNFQTVRRSLPEFDKACVQVISNCETSENIYEVAFAAFASSALMFSCLNCCCSMSSLVNAAVVGTVFSGAAALVQKFIDSRSCFSSVKNLVGQTWFSTTTYSDFLTVLAFKELYPGLNKLPPKDMQLAIKNLKISAFVQGVVCYGEEQQNCERCGIKAEYYEDNSYFKTFKSMMEKGLLEANSIPDFRTVLKILTLPLLNPDTCVLPGPYLPKRYEFTQEIDFQILFGSEDKRNQLLKLSKLIHACTD